MGVTIMIDQDSTALIIIAFNSFIYFLHRRPNTMTVPTPADKAMTWIGTALAVGEQ